MQLLIEIQDDKASFFLELLQNFKYIKTTSISAKKATHIKELKQAIEQIKLHKEGKIKLQSARDLLDEL